MQIVSRGRVGRSGRASKGDRELQRFLRTCALVGIALSATASSVQAKTLEQMRFHEQETEIVRNYCGGLTVRLDLDDSGVFVIRSTGPDRLPRFTATHHGGITITNVATGK